jgi:hypothetical protein
MVGASLSFGTTNGVTSIRTACKVNNITVLTAILLQGLRREGDRVVGTTWQDCKEDLEQQMTLPVSATNGHSVDRGHYNRFCQGSHGINWIHMKSWILASTSSSGKSATAMSLQGTKSLRAMINCYTCTGENNSFNWFQLVTQLVTTTTQEKPELLTARSSASVS